MSRLSPLSPSLWTLLCLAALNALPANAQENAPAAPPTTPQAVAPIESASEPEISLDELIQRALKNSPELPIARENLEAARQRLGASRAMANPVLQAVPGFSGSREARDEEVILSQPVDLFGKRRARAAVAGAEVRRATAESTAAERSLIVSVKNAATDLFAAQESEALGGIQVQVAQLFRNAAARRAELGDVPPVQVQRADLELLRVQNELTAAQSERLARLAGLNQLIGQAPETPLRVGLPISTGLTDVLKLAPRSFGASASAAAGSGATDSEAAPAAAIAGAPTTASTPTDPQTPLVGGSSQAGSELAGLRAQLLPGLVNRPDIVGAQAGLEARQAQVKVLRRERLPSIELQARRGTFSGSSSTAFRAVVVMPLFDLGSNKRERRALEAEARAQEASISLLRTKAATQVEQALVRLQQQRQTVERYRAGIVPQTVDLLNKTQTGYALGASTYLEVLEAQRTLRQVQTEYLQALTGTRTSEAQLETAIGAPLPAALTETENQPAAPPTPEGGR